MAYVSHISLQHANNDYMCQCDNCGKYFVQYIRSYASGCASHSTGILSHITNAPQRDTAISTNIAMSRGSKELTNCIKYPHRCTECGHYTKAALKTINDSYEWYQQIQLNASSWAFVIAGIASVLGIAFIIFFITNVGTDDILAAPLPLVIWVIPCIIYGILVRPRTREKYISEVNLANSTAAVKIWRANWDKKGERLLIRYNNAKIEPGSYQGDFERCARYWRSSCRQLHYCDPWWPPSFRYASFSTITTQVTCRRIANIIILSVALGSLLALFIHILGISLLVSSIIGLLISVILGFKWNPKLIA